ncbi:hypothetical protein, partial [Streptomyces brasiliscabiei]|uniref:hypothetical protein n=1 Tax=Streptomyces brasiliscabiei TaxID=2736302 RepID=UPI003015887D
SLVPASLLDQYNDNDNFLYGDTAWTAASGYTNGWGVYSGVVGFRKIGTKVELRGLFSAGTIGNPAFTLPAGYRPSQNC